MYCRIAALVCLFAFGLGLSGCTKCGWIWNDGQRVCHSDAPATR